MLVEVKNARRQEEAFKSVKSLFPGLVISSYACYRPAEQVMGINEDAFCALGAGIAVFVLLLVMRSQIAAVMERRREIGMLKAIGWSDNNVVRLLFAETLLQAAAGVAVGCLLCGGLAADGRGCGFVRRRVAPRPGCRYWVEPWRLFCPPGRPRW